MTQKPEISESVEKQFFKSENICASSLLKIVAKGSAILAELQRLSTTIPKIFSANGQQNQMYKDILFGFEYLQNQDQYEDKIQQNQDLIELDEQFKSTYSELLERFYQLFENIYFYYCDIKEFLDEVKDGVFVQYTFSNLLTNLEGKKLVVEAFYLYGCMLLLMDRLIVGPIRERIVIQYYRYKGGSQAIRNITNIVQLCTKTGYLPASYTGQDKDQRPKFYPEEYFMRFAFDEKLIEQVVNAIKDDDIYKYLNAYPSPEHRTFALANQAAQLYVILFFNGDILDNQKATMREIVDKHFQDNWVIPFYLGYYVDLTVEWQSYKAARAAMDNTFDLDLIQEFTNYHLQKLEECYNKCNEYLIEGVLTEEYILDKLTPIMNCIRDCNVTIRWLMLHRKSIHPKINQVVNKNLQLKDILSLLLVSSKFEEQFKALLEKLIQSKQEKWDKDQNASKERMTELSELFEGKRSFGKIEKDEQYAKWFQGVANEIIKIQYDDATYAGRKITQLIKALENIEQYHQIDQNQSIKYYLEETRKDLKHMMKIVAVQNNLTTYFSIVTDFTYSWQCLSEYMGIMQQKVKKHPQVSLMLKSTFVKLSSILNTPLQRLFQADSQDVNSVSQFYSNELMNFVQEVLQIIPQEVFDILEKIIQLITQEIKDFPFRLNKNELKDYQFVAQRNQVAQFTYRISLFTQSILNMEKYLIGVLEVNPKEILENGIRKELIKLICKILDKHLIFKTGQIEEFQTQLNNLASQLSGFKKAVEYIQDFICTYGIKAFHEEFDELITCYIEMEEQSFLTNKLDLDALFYDKDIPMPDPKKIGGSINFMGRLVKSIQNLTNQRQCIYLEQALGFFEFPSGKEILSLKTLSLLYKCIGVSGLNGVDKLLAFEITTIMNQLVSTLRNEIQLNQPNRKLINDSFASLKDLNSFNEKSFQIYDQLKKQFARVLSNLIVPLMKIGQIVLIRRLITLQLQIMGKVGSNRLFLCLENLNQTLINDMQNRIYNEEMKKQENIEKENLLIYESSLLFNFIGLNDPQRKIYITPESVDCLPLLLFLMTQNALTQIDYDSNMNILIKKISKDPREQPIEPTYLIVGVITFLGQYHPNNSETYLGFLSHSIKTLFNLSTIRQEQKIINAETMGDLFLNIAYFDEFLQYSNQNKQDLLHHLLPIELVNSYKREILAKAQSVNKKQ